MLELLAEDVYVTMIPVKPVAKDLCLLYATITAYRLCPNRGRSIVCDIGLWLISAGGYLFVSTYSCLLYATANSSGYALVGERSTVFDARLNGRESLVLPGMNNGCLLDATTHTPGRC